MTWKAGHPRVFRSLGKTSRIVLIQLRTPERWCLGFWRESPEFGGEWCRYGRYCMDGYLPTQDVAAWMPVPGSRRYYDIGGALDDESENAQRRLF